MTESKMSPRTFHGIGCSPGYATGAVTWADEELPGTIWAFDGPLGPSIVMAAHLNGALALLVKSGGATSHGASIARELNLPVVSGLADLREIKSGSSCHCNGATGDFILIDG